MDKHQKGSHTQDKTATPPVQKAPTNGLQKQAENNHAAGGHDKQQGLYQGKQQQTPPPTHGKLSNVADEEEDVDSSAEDGSANSKKSDKSDGKQNENKSGNQNSKSGKR